MGAQNKLKNYGGKTPWETMEVKEEVKPWPWNDRGEMLDPRKYIGRCAFIDLSMTGIGEESDGLDSEDDDDDEGKEEEQKSTMNIKQTPNGTTSRDHGANGQHVNSVNSVNIPPIQRIHFPEIGQ